MIKVKLFRAENGSPDDAGTLEFYGVPLATADGSTWLEFTGGECGSHAQVRLTPSGVASESEVTAIGLALCRNEVEGQAGRYEWRGD
jgi:hypothetical protein